MYIFDVEKYLGPTSPADLVTEALSEMWELKIITSSDLELRGSCPLYGKRNRFVYKDRPPRGAKWKHPPFKPRCRPSMYAHIYILTYIWWEFRGRAGSCWSSLSRL